MTLYTKTEHTKNEKSKKINDNFIPYYMFDDSFEMITWRVICIVPCTPLLMANKTIASTQLYAIHSSIVLEYNPVYMTEVT